jgi:hypothetical protein
MASRRILLLLAGWLALAACKRTSEPPAGPGAKPSGAASAADSIASAPPATARANSVHDRDMPETPPPHPPTDHAALIKVSHILIAYQGAQDAPPRVTRDKATALKLANSVGREARAGAPFSELVAKYSDDPQAKANDGKLGQISRTQMAKPFTDAAFGLMVKEITMDPVETASGFHIIKRTE